MRKRTTAGDSHNDQPGTDAGQACQQLIRQIEKRPGDLHLHTTDSDGSDTTEQLTERVLAAVLNLDLLLTSDSDDQDSSQNNVHLHNQNGCRPERPSLLVTGALVTRLTTDKTKRYLLCRRRSPGRQAGLWELPGGKVEAGETLEKALKRELHEELAVDAVIGPLKAVLCHDYPDTRVVLAVLEADFPIQELVLSVHDQFALVTPREALQLPLLPADVTLFAKLQSDAADMPSL